MIVSNEDEMRFVNMICEIEDRELFYQLAQAFFRKIARKQQKQLLNQNYIYDKGNCNTK